MDIGKFIVGSNTGRAAPIDSARGNNKKPKVIVRGLTPKYPTYSNIAWVEGTIFKLNLIASELAVTPPGFGNIQLDTAITLFGKNLKNRTLTAVGR